MKTIITNQKLQDFLLELNESKNEMFLFVVDKNIEKIYQISSLIKKNLTQKIFFIYIPEKDKEDLKTYLEFEKCSEFFLSRNINRNAHLIAIGGGALSDFAGFVASSLLRGISWSIVSTTLLSMVDASIGGKVGLNSSFGKNLIGHFHLPQKIILNIEFLNSLSQEELNSGKGEILKYFFLDKTLHVSKDFLDLEKIILHTSSFKNKICEDDFLEKENRRFLNYGHTFGHALEKIYHLPHGMAVFWGIYLKIHFLKQKNLISTFKKMANLLDLPYKNPPWEFKDLSFEEMAPFLLKDKKRTNQKTVALISVEEIGFPEISEFSIEEIKKFFEGDSWKTL